MRPSGASSSLTPGSRDPLMLEQTNGGEICINVHIVGKTTIPKDEVRQY